MTPAPLPPKLRHRLADAIVAALHDGPSRQALAALSSDRDIACGWCGSEEREYGDLVRVRAQRAVEALAALPLGVRARDVDDALEGAAALFDASLFFETHEVLEPHWRQARGETREILQGLIQVAVGYQHWMNGNWEGARSLLAQGSARLRGRRIRGASLDAFADSVSRSIERVERMVPAPPPFPRFPPESHRA
jgi:hypothetical protein